MPPPEGTPGPRRPSVAVLVAALVAVALVAGLVTFFLLSGDDSDDVASGTPTTSADPSDPGPASPTTVAPPQPVSEEVLRAEVDELSAFVADARGLQWLTPVEVEVVDDEEFERRLFEEFDEDRELIELQGRVLEAFGLVEPGTDLVAATEKLLGQGVLGFYNRKTQELVVRGVELTPLVRQTIVHELVHALDDQHFELYRPEYDDRDDEIAEAFIAVIEGNARRVEAAWEAGLSEDERRARDREEARMSLQADLSGIPPVLIEMLIWPYIDGHVFVDALVEAGGDDEVNEALTNPPETTAQVLHPEKFFARVGRVEVAPAEVEGTVIDEGVFGEQMLRILLRERLTSRVADAAASGWAGDWYVAYEPADGGTCVVLDVVTDSPASLDDLLSGLEQYVFDRPSAEVRSTGDDSLRFESCTEGGGGGSEGRT